MYWYAWFSGTFLSLIFALIFIAEKINGGTFSWGMPFALFYILIGIMLIVVIAPCFKYSGAWTRTDRNIDHVRHESGNIFFDFVLTGLLLTFFILLPIQLTSIDDGNPPAFAASFIVLIIILSLLLLYVIGSIVARTYFSATQSDDVPAWTSFYTVFVCCRTSSEAHNPELEKRYLPTCFGGVQVDHWTRGLYYGSYIFLLAMSILTVALLIPFIDAMLPASSLGSILWPLFIALWITALASIALAINLSSERGQLGTAMIVGIHAVIYILLFVFGISLIHTTGTQPHALFAVLYVAFGIGFIMYFILYLMAHCYPRLDDSDNAASSSDSSYSIIVSDKPTEVDWEAIT